MRATFLAMIAAAASAAPAGAAAGDAAAFLGTATDTCDALMAAPEAAVAGAVLRPGKASGAITADRALLNYATALPGGDGSVVLQRTVYPEGSATTCTATRVHPGLDSELADELPALIDARAEALLGMPATRAGGPVPDPDGTSVMHTWHGEGFPPRASIRLVAAPRVTILSLTRIAAGVK